MKKFIISLFISIFVLSFSLTANAAEQELPQDTTATHFDNSGYRIDKPGTITFTVGVKIKGKVEKPQVMIFLPKEKPVYNKLVLTNSFKDDIMRPMEFTPLDK